MEVDEAEDKKEKEKKSWTFKKVSRMEKEDWMGMGWMLDKIG